MNTHSLYRSTFVTLLFAATVLLPFGCTLFSGSTRQAGARIGLSSATDAPSFAELTEEAGTIVTAAYRAATPPGWTYARTNPDQSGGVILVGNAPDQSLQFSVLWMEAGPDSESSRVLPALEDYVDYRLGLLGGDYRAAEVEIDGTRIPYLAGADDEEQLLMVPLCHDGSIIALTLLGQSGAFSLDQNSVRGMVQSFSVEPSGAPQRFDGALPEFYSPDRRWNWAADIPGGFVLHGEIDSRPCAVSVVATDTAVVAEEESGAVFTGVALYTIHTLETEDNTAQFLLQSETHRYRLKVDWFESSGVDPLSSPDFMTLIEHHLILDDEEAAS